MKNKRHKRQSQIVLFSLIIIITIIGFSMKNGRCVAVLDEAEDYKHTTKGYSYYKSWADIQGDVLYEDEVGFTRYAVFIKAEHSFWSAAYSTRIYVEMHVSAHYYWDVDSGPNQDFWDPAPDGLVDWTSDYEFDHDYDDEIWQWEQDNDEFYCNGDETSSTSGTSRATYQNSATSGDWRNIGYLCVSKSGGSGYQLWDALIKLHIDNEDGDDYYNGIREYKDEVGWYTETITEFRFKLRFKFQYEWFGYHTDSTHEMILGDGVGVGDLSSIPLLMGTMYEIE